MGLSISACILLNVHLLHRISLNRTAHCSGWQYFLIQRAKRWQDELYNYLIWHKGQVWVTRIDDLRCLWKLCVCTPQEKYKPNRYSELKVTEIVSVCTMLLALYVLTWLLPPTLIYWHSNSYFIISLNWGWHFGWGIWRTTLIGFSLKTADSTEHEVWGEFEERHETQSHV